MELSTVAYYQVHIIHFLGQEFKAQGYRQLFHRRHTHTDRWFAVDFYLLLCMTCGSPQI